MHKTSDIVLFDIDGTLLRGAGPHHKNALIQGIRRITGLTTTLDGIPTAGTLDRDLIAAMLRNAGVPDHQIGGILPSVVVTCQNAYVENCAADLRPFVCPGVREFLEKLKQSSAILGLVTGNLREIGWKKVELAGLREYFAVGAFSDDGHTRAELAAIAAKRAQDHSQWVQARRTISLVGDHANDILAAKANGFRSVAVATGVSSVDELREFQPDLVVRDLTEVDPAQVIKPAA